VQIKSLHIIIIIIIINNI